MIERKPPYLDAWLEEWVPPWFAVLTLLFAAFDGACGWRYRRR